MTQEQKKTSRRRMVGTVLSNKMKKTAVVEISTLMKHAKYGKYFRKYKKLKAHDEAEQCQIGDRVELIESRPISKEKMFRITKILEKAKRAEVEVDQIAQG